MNWEEGGGCHLEPITYFSRSWGCWLKNPSLHLAGQGTVDRKDDQFGDLGPQGLHSLIQGLTGSVNLLLTGQEQQNVTWGTERDIIDKLVQYHRHTNTYKGYTQKK